MMRSTWTRRDLLRFTAGVALALPALSLLAACGDDDEDEPTASAGGNATSTIAGSASGATATSATSGGGAHTVSMTAQSTFDPDHVTIKVGDTITWKSTATFPHTSTCDPAKAAKPEDAVLPEGAETWDSGTLNAGQEFSHTFDTAGEYTYFCVPHEAMGMVGHVTVEA